MLSFTNRYLPIISFFISFNLCKKNNEDSEKNYERYDDPNFIYRVI